MLLFINNMISYADGLDDNCYFDEDNKIWYDGTFNHQQNFEKLMLMTEHKNEPIKIIEGFLISRDKMEN